MDGAALAVCLRCAGSYGMLVAADCPLCEGRGLLAVKYSGGDPKVAARAVGMLLGVANTGGGWWGADGKISGARASGLLGDVGSASSSVVAPPADVNALGRTAAQLLRDLGLRDRKKPRQPAKRRTRAEIAAEKAERLRQIEESNRHRQEQRNQRKDRQIKARALLRTGEAYLAAHPDEASDVHANELAFAEVEQSVKDHPFEVRSSPWSRT